MLQLCCILLLLQASIRQLQEDKAELESRVSEMTERYKYTCVHIAIYRMYEEVFNQLILQLHFHEHEISHVLPVYSTSKVSQEMLLARFTMLSEVFESHCSF
jgi:hypothetical protein